MTLVLYITRLMTNDWLLYTVYLSFKIVTNNVFSAHRYQRQPRCLCQQYNRDRIQRCSSPMEPQRVECEGEHCCPLSEYRLQQPKRSQRIPSSLTNRHIRESKRYLPHSQRIRTNQGVLRQSKYNLHFINMQE